MLPKLSLLAVCSTLLLSVNAQSNCPNASVICSSDSCTDAVCPRYFNADCHINTCDEVCTPNFFYRGRNVTNRCGDITCDTRNCPPNRQCMESVTPSSCPSGSVCRQRLHVRCVLQPQPQPMTCEDIDCGEGMMCRMRERRNYRRPVIRCVPAPPTDAPPIPTKPTTMTAEPTILPITTTSTPLTTWRVSTQQPTVSPTPLSTSCQSVNCIDGSECIEFPVDFIPGIYSGPTCFPSVRTSCEELSCQSNQVCITQSIPVADFTASSCILASTLPLLNTSVCNNTNCGDEDSGCVISMHPSIVTSSTCLRGGLNLTVQLFTFVLNQSSTTTSSPSTVTSSSISTLPTSSTPSTFPFSTVPPMSTLFTTTLPAPTEPTLCSTDCSSTGQQCVGFPIEVPNGEMITTGICVPILGLSCDDITCLEDQSCVDQSFVERNFDIAQCVSTSSLNSSQIRRTSCSILQCPPGSVCTDLRIGETQIMGTCLQTGCVNNSDCTLQVDDVCTLIPSESGLDIPSVCVPSFVDAQFTTQTCEMSGRMCPSPLACQEAYQNDTLVSTFCAMNPFPSSCDQVVCAEGQECTLSTSIFGSVASCASEVDSIISVILQLLEILGLIDNTGSPQTANPTEIFTAFSTIAPPTTTDIPCSLDCSSTGQVCRSFGNGISTCIPPSSCTTEFSAYCSSRLQLCQESNSQAFCAVPTSCSQVNCPSPFQCFEFPPEVTGANNTQARCGPPTALRCEDLTCNVTGLGRCVITELSMRGLSYAQCGFADGLEQQLNASVTCDVLECSEGSVCIDLERNGFPVLGSCLSSGCSTSNSTCMAGTTCTSVPSDFGLEVDSVCVPSNVEPIVGTQTCAENGRVCPLNSGQLCHEAVIDGTLVGTACSPRSSIRVSACQQSVCPQGEECLLHRIEGFEESLQSCFPSLLADQTAAFIEQILLD